MFPNKLNVIFFGTPEFSIPSLSVLHHHPKINLIHIISMPDRPSGRGQELKSPPVIDYAKKFKIPFTQTANINLETSLLNELKDKVDFIVVLAFAQFLKTPWLNLPKLGCFNIHTSLLPKYRGAAPIQYALLNNDTETGVSIQKMVLKMDAGNVVDEFKIPIYPHDNAESLSTKLQFLAAVTLDRFIYKLLSSSFTETIQNEELVSLAPEIAKNMGYVDFKNEKVSSIFSKMRGLTPWPGLYFFLNSKRVKIIELIVPSPNELYKISPGEIKIMYKQLIVGCADGPIRISSLQMEGKSVSQDSQFIQGIKETLQLTKE